jgi:hypothetical protein
MTLGLILNFKKSLASATIKDENNYTMLITEANLVYYQPNTLESVYKGEI